MKTSQVLASLLFGSIAAAAPVNKRELFTKTEWVMETVVVYTTVWDGESVSAAATTTSAGAFYESPSKAATTTKATSTVTSTSVYTPPAVPSSSVKVEATSAAAPSTTAPAYTPPASSAAPVQSSSSAYTPSPVSSSAPAPVSSAPAQTSSASSGGGLSGSYSNVDITVYDANADGACGYVGNDDPYVALSQGLMGASTYDVATGNPTNQYCGQKVQITYNGNSYGPYTIMDRCAGCDGPNDLDLTRSVWDEVTDNAADGRYHGVSWTFV